MFISAKTHKENVPWNEVPVEAVYILPKTEPCYLSLELIITLFDYEAQDIETEAIYFIDVYIDSGYWKVLAEEDAQ